MSFQLRRLTVLRYGWFKVYGRVSYVLTCSDNAEISTKYLPCTAEITVLTYGPSVIAVVDGNDNLLVWNPHLWPDNQPLPPKVPTMDPFMDWTHRSRVTEGDPPHPFGGGCPQGICTRCAREDCRSCQRLVQDQCPHCGEALPTPPYKVGTHRFCTRKCAEQWIAPEPFQPLS